ncbi:FHA domain-containing protein FhaB/FipA [Corynebacterium auriscanis]|uniref:FHA domain-containing protein FhaB/FipA n=1 Tax=Corynebacterium auriscanis TaxID=99807 RepID=UPI0022453177|nr:FHA domain-containing protein [Corynebacterium auriscanis]MCX2163601.1 FHA domain-containing protein [Corynebacterium auriscanis]
MQTTLLLLAKVALLILLWFFIWMSVRALRKEANRASGLHAGAAPVAAAPAIPGGGMGGEQPSGPGIGRGFRRAKAPRALTLISGPLTGTYLNLQGYNEVTLGRSQDCTLVLEDDFASGRHARLINRGSDWFIEDLDSRNGTWLNNQRIDQLERLSAGAEVRIGQTNVRMEA